MKSDNLKYGIISEVDYQNGVARVYIDELDIVTDWATLPKNINQNWNFPLKSQVAVLFHENGEDCEILHEVPFTGRNSPEWANENTEGVQFKDGTTVIYDNNSKKLTISAGSGEIEFVCSKLTVSGDIVADGDVTAGTGKISLINHIHTSPVGPTGKPIGQ